ncbi:Modification methylase BspRI [Peribacillus sp. Bi134]|nr:Modification methylase BspRI [Peribacillus sp. Bi134]
MASDNELEKKILALFNKKNSCFKLRNEIFQIKFSGKPVGSKKKVDGVNPGGEPKTDVFVRGENSKGVIIDLKISVKQLNAQFIENKLSIFRAEAILGSNWRERVLKAIYNLEERFKQKNLIYIDKLRRTEAGAFSLGWIINFMNSGSGELATRFELSRDELLEIYAGYKLPETKKNVAIQVEKGNQTSVIKNSGIAEFIVHSDVNAINSIQDVIDNLQHIEEYVDKNPNTYIAFKALNYRTLKDGKARDTPEFDGDRPLGIYVDWGIKEGRLFPQVHLEDPLEYKGNLVANRLKTSLESLGIKSTYDIRSDNVYNTHFVWCKDARWPEKENFNMIFKPNEISNAFNVLNLNPNDKGLDLGFKLSKMFKMNYINSDIKHGKQLSFGLDSTKIKHLDSIETDLIIGKAFFPLLSLRKSRLNEDAYEGLDNEILDYLKYVQPKMFLFTSLKSILKVHNGDLMKDFSSKLANQGFKVQYKLLNARDYGVAQNRSFVFIVGVREDLDFKYEYPLPKYGECLQPYVTLSDAIGDLDENPGPYYKGKLYSYYKQQNRKKEWSDESFNVNVPIFRTPLHPSGSSLIKNENNEWIFPDGEENYRRLSIREISRIQSFPDWYTEQKIEQKMPLSALHLQLAYSVPVLLAQAISNSIVECLLKSNLR